MILTRIIIRKVKQFLSALSTKCSSREIFINNPSGKDENESFSSAAMLLKRGTLYAHRKCYDERDWRTWRGEPAAEFQEWG